VQRQVRAHTSSAAFCRAPPLAEVVYTRPCRSIIQFHSLLAQRVAGLGKTNTAVTLVMSTKGRRPAPLSITTLTEQERSAAVDERWH
jgi:hypothetical protein